MQERAAWLGARRVRRWEDRLGGDGRRDRELELRAILASALKRLENGFGAFAYRETIMLYDFGSGGSIDQLSIRMQLIEPLKCESREVLRESDLVVR